MTTVPVTLDLSRWRQSVDTFFDGVYWKTTKVPWDVFVLLTTHYKINKTSVSS